MTKIQFDTIRGLARAYNHEWATGLDFAQVWVAGTEHETTRGAVYRKYADPATAYDLGLNEPTPEQIAHCAQWAAWIDLHDRIESGHVPTFDEIESLSVPLFEHDHYPSTPWIALRHETCTGRTRWEVRPDGEVRFEFISDSPTYGTDPSRRLLAVVYSSVRPDGARDAAMEISAPVAEWGSDHADRVRRALHAIGCADAVIEGAFRRAKRVLGRLITQITVQFDGPDAPGRAYEQCPPASSHPHDSWSGCVLRWDGQSLSVVEAWGPSPFGSYGSAAKVARTFRFITEEQFETLTAFDRRAWARYHVAEAERAERRKPVPPASRIVGGARRRRNARRRLSR